MNLNPNAIRILCYGNSNTWGQVPHNATPVRYPVGVRWTSLLQAKLGDSYWIIEEGLNGRTTMLDQAHRVGKNGKTYLRPCLQSQNPIDIVILMLGTNDLKEQFHLSAKDIANNVAELVQMIQEFGLKNDGKTSNIVLVSPPYVDESVHGTQLSYKDAEEKSKQLGECYRQVAEKYQCSFVDIAQYVMPSKLDGYHLDPDAHTIISHVLESKIKEMV